MLSLKVNVSDLLKLTNKIGYYWKMDHKFEIGEVVICINAKRRRYRLGGLQENEMYTVTGFNPYDGGLILKEVKSPGSAYHAFVSKRFRKVDYNFAERLLAQLESQSQPSQQHIEQLIKEEYILSILN